MMFLSHLVVEQYFLYHGKYPISRILLEPIDSKIPFVQLMACLITSQTYNPHYQLQTLPMQCTKIEEKGNSMAHKQ